MEQILEQIKWDRDRWLWDAEYHAVVYMAIYQVLPLMIRNLALIVNEDESIREMRRFLTGDLTPTEAEDYVEHIRWHRVRRS